MVDRLLVPVDGSPFAEQALPYAIALARRCGGEILLARAVPPVVPVGTPTAHLAGTGWSAWAAEAEAAEADLAKLRAEVEASGVAAATSVLGGEAAAVVLELGRAPDVRLIVMATHGRSGLSRWVLGSVAERVLRDATRPLLLLTPRALGAGTADRLGQSAVVAHDGSALSDRVLPPVLALARCLETPITLVRAVEPGTIYAMEVRALFGSVHPRDLAQQATDAAHAQLRALAEQWGEAGAAMATVVDVKPATELIVGSAAERGAGWIAMASHGRGGLSGLVLGSTALSVLRQTTLPVLLVAGHARDAAASPTEAPADAAARSDASPARGA